MCDCVCMCVCTFVCVRTCVCVCAQETPTTSTKCTKRKKVIAEIGETIAIVLLAFVVDELQFVAVGDGTFRST
jgi:hypothetical protein